MNDYDKALRGDHEAAKRLTDAGVLVPCPFCGGEAFVSGQGNRKWVECDKCWIEGPTMENSRAARLAWNTRAPILSESELKNLCKGGEED